MAADRIHLSEIGLLTYIGLRVFENCISVLLYRLVFKLEGFDLCQFVGSVAIGNGVGHDGFAAGFFNLVF